MNPDSEIYELLECKTEQYNRSSFVETDPVSIPRLFTKKEDIEIAGFLAATIAWGQRPTILKNARELMKRMDHSPYEFIIAHQPSDLKKFDSFVHRTFNANDCKFFIRSLQNIYTRHESLEQVVSSGNGTSIKDGIINLRKVFFELPSPSRTKKHVSDPDANAAAKRINMFLRWMVRKDKRGVDFGIWKSIKPSQLCCPLDIHSGNVARKLGLLKRKQNDWKAVAELTAELRRFDKKDPVKYDFALFGLGAFEGWK